MNHPVLGSKVRLIVWWLVWLFIGLGQSLIYYFAYGSFIQICIPDSIISVCIYSGLSLMLWYPFRFFNHSVTNPAVLISNLVVSGGITVVLWLIATNLITTLFFPKEISYPAYCLLSFCQS
jgi:hypothetical protein